MGENTCHHYLCTVLPQIHSAKSDFILAISVSKTHPLPPPPPKFCMIIVCNFSWVLQSSQEMRTKRQCFFFFFWWGGGGLGGNNLHCGLCENGKLLSFWFSFHSAYCRKIFKDHVLITRVDIGVVS